MCGPPSKFVDEVMRKMGEAAARSDFPRGQCLFKGHDKGMWLKGYDSVRKEVVEYGSHTAEVHTGGVGDSQGVNESPHTG